MRTESDILSTIMFSQTANWNIKQFFNKNTITSSFKLERIGKVLTRCKEKMTVEDNQVYKRITIKTSCGGVFVRDETLGKEIKTKCQYYIKSGQLAVSKIDARNGAFGIVPPEADRAIITANFWVYDVDCSIANIGYLTLLLSSDFFVQAWQDCSNGSGNRLYLQEQKFLNYKIPLPDISVQNQLVEKYKQCIRESEAIDRKANSLEEEIEAYLFETLMIPTLPAQIISEKLLLKTRFKNLVGWGAKVNCNPIKPQEVFQSNHYKGANLEYFGELNPNTKYPPAINEISFIPMECVSDIYGEVTETYSGNTSDSKGYTKFKEQDILWAKITPCMQNGKCAIAKNLKNGFGYGSTEFHVFRTNQNALPEYIYCFLRSKRLREVAISYFTGSVGQQRVGADFLSALTIPKLPIFSDSSDVMTQEKLVRHVFNIKRQIKELNNAADSLRSRAKKEFGEAVFGET